MKKHFSKNYKRMMKKYQKEAKAIAKNCKPWDWGWSVSFVINHLKWMKEYYTLKENVIAKENCEWDPKVTYTRLEMIDRILNAYNELQAFEMDYTNWNELTAEEKVNRRNNYNTTYEFLKHKCFELIELYMHELWD